jgi:hypothetical protein
MNKITEVSHTAQFFQAGRPLDGWQVGAGQESQFGAANGR